MMTAPTARRAQAETAGSIAARGTHEELLVTSQVYRDIYEHGLLERQFADAVEARAETDALEAAS